MRKGYRNADEHFNISSNTEQFSFDNSDSFLKVDFFSSLKMELAPIERVHFFLKDGRVLRNIFVVNGELAYYYEKDWYYKGDIRSEVPKPPENVQDRFKFKKEDVLLALADNSPKPAVFNFGNLIGIDRLFGQKSNPLDTKKSIEKNIFIRVENWKELPNPSSDILYSKK